MWCSFYPHCNLMQIISGHMATIISAVNTHMSEYNVQTSLHTTVLLPCTMAYTVHFYGCVLQ